MAKITLRIDADTSAVSTALANLKKDVTALSATKIDFGGFDASAFTKATNALAKQATAEAKLAAEERKLQTEKEKTARATVNANSKMEQAEARAALSAQKHGEKMEEIAAKTQSATTATNAASGAFNALSVALGNIAARGFHMVVSKITQGIREAVKEMKEVDTQLTNISKVSGITGQALEDMGERAYETASKYGVSADEYLSAVYTFQKAGLGESAEAMGELAVKTMLVGDTTADVASQFLISANAAWKFGGNIEDLNRIVDEADYINNNYATDLTKLSQGLPRVASVAAQAGMSAEETLAAIGTITAVTQESGTKAATALRALILNIEGQVGEFVDETGETFTVTEESVKSMQGLMEKYAKAELDAARASGELINPMTAIKAIFEGMANSDLNNQELFTLLSGMGGKLRTNQLTALVQNYKLFDDMLGKIANSAGTADSEIALMMESWERKTQVLKNTWTEFIADVVNTDTIKGSIDELTNLISTLDDALFKDKYEVSRSKYYDLNDELLELESRGNSLNEIERQRLEYLKAQTAELDNQAKKQAEWEAKNWQMKSGHAFVENGPDGMPLYTDQAMYESLAAGWGSAGEQFGLGNINSAEYITAMKKVVEANRDYYDNLIKCKDAGVALTDWQEKFVTDFEATQRAAEATSVSLRDTAEGYFEIVDAQGNVLGWTDKYTTLQEKAAEKEQERQKAQQDAANEYQEALQEQTEAFESAQASIERAKAGADDLSEGEAGAKEVAVELASAADAISFDDATAGARRLAAALEAAAAASAGIAPGAGYGFAGGTTNAPGGRTLVNELGPELISENGKAYIANGGRPAVVNLSKGAVVLPANVTKNALRGGPAKTINAAAGGIGGRDATAVEEAQRAREAAIGESQKYDQTHPYTWTCPKCKTVNLASNKKCSKCGTAKPGSSSKKTGGGGKKKSKKEKAQDAAKKLQDELTNLDKQATLAHHEEKYDKESGIYSKAISLIKKQITVYQKAGYKDKSNEILDLKNKIHDYEAKIESLKKAEADREKEKWDAEIEARQAEIDARRKQEEQQSKEEAAANAKIALENAKKQRNVRVFNAATGQWEWVADQGAIDKAQKAYDSAQEALLRAQEDAEIEALKARRDAGEKYGGTSTSTVGAAATVQGTLSQLYGSVSGLARQYGLVYGGAGSVGEVATTRLGGGQSDSHDTIYNFGSISMSEAEAQAMTVAQLARKLSVLKIS